MLYIYAFKEPHDKDIGTIREKRAAASVKQIKRQNIWLFPQK